MPINITSTPVTYEPRIVFRVLATCWESEEYIECYTETLDSANLVSIALQRVHDDATIQIDKVTKPTTQDCVTPS